MKVMGKILIFFGGTMFLLGAAGPAYTSLTVIGTAQFGGMGTEYNLIWEDNNNGNSLVWLDFTHGYETWPDQMSWASGLDGTLTINPSGYEISWQDTSWRLPTSPSKGSGANITTSEMGYLYYTELGNSFSYFGGGFVNSGPFENIYPGYTWSSTNDPSPYHQRAWWFNFNTGEQGWSNYTIPGVKAMGLAVRSAEVSAVPIPCAAWLLGSGLMGLIAVQRRKNTI